MIALVRVQFVAFFVSMLCQADFSSLPERLGGPLDILLLRLLFDHVNYLLNTVMPPLTIWGPPCEAGSVGSWSRSLGRMVLGSGDFKQGFCQPGADKKIKIESEVCRDLEAKKLI